MKYIFGTSILALMILLSSCQKELSSNVDPVTNDSTNTTAGGTDTTGGNGTDTTSTNSDYTFYYDAMIDGIHYVQGVTDNNGYEPGTSLAGEDDVIIGGSINPSPGTTGKTSMGILKGTMHGYINASNADFKNFFAPGDYLFSAGAKDGVSVGWSDENGTDWESDKGSGDQTGSTFKIISVEDYQNVINYSIKIKVQFNCKVYDDSGHMKTITNAIFVGDIDKI